MPSGDIILLYIYAYICTIKENHMIYGSWNIRCDKQKFLSFWAVFCPLSPLKTGKIKIFKLKKTPWDIIISHICTINDSHICMVPEIWSTTGRLFCYSGPFLALSPRPPPPPPPPPYLWKWKKILEIFSFHISHMCTINDNHMMCGSWDTESVRQNFLSF